MEKHIIGVIDVIAPRIDKIITLIAYVYDSILYLIIFAPSTIGVVGVVLVIIDVGMIEIGLVE